MVERQSDVTKVEYPERGELPSNVPRDAGEVFDIVVRKGPISIDEMMRKQIHSMSRDDVWQSLQGLLSLGYVDNVDGDIHEHGTTRKVWYVPTDDTNAE